MNIINGTVASAPEKPLSEDDLLHAAGTARVAGCRSVAFF